MTGITHIRLLEHSTFKADSRGPVLRCIDLTLWKHCGSETLPASITIKEQGICFPTEQLPKGRCRLYAHTDISHDGHIRGFFVWDKQEGVKFRSRYPNQDWRVMKFEIVDTTREDTARGRLPNGFGMMGLMCTDG